MTQKQALAEAKKRWEGPFDPAFAEIGTYRRKKNICMVGIQRSMSKNGKGTWDWVLGYGDTWEEAFANADGKKPKAKKAA